LLGHPWYCAPLTYLCISARAHTHTTEREIE
jgi:hypothetical protein